VILEPIMDDRTSTPPIAIHPPDGSFADSFGAALLSARVLDGQAIDRAQRAAATTGERFDHVLAKLGMLSEADLAAHLARFLGLIHYIPGERTHGRLLDDALPAPFLLQNRILPIEIEDETLRLAVVDPFDPLPIEAIRHVTGKQIVPEIITGADFDRIANALYGDQRAQAAREPREASDESAHARWLGSDEIRALPPRKRGAQESADLHDSAVTAPSWSLL